MTALRARQYVIPSIGVLVAIAAAFLPVSLPATDTIVPEGKDYRPAGNIVAGVTVTEQFPAAAHSIETITLLLATYQRVNHGTLHIVVSAMANGHWADLAVRDLRKEALQDNAYYQIVFSPPLPVVRGQPTRITLGSEEGVADAVTWQSNPAWRGDGYILTVNGRRVSGNAIFQVSYTAESGPLFREIDTIWHRATGYLNAFWKVIFVLGIGGLLIGGLFILGRSFSD